MSVFTRDVPSVRDAVSERARAQNYDIRPGANQSTVDGETDAERIARRRVALIKQDALAGEGSVPTDVALWSPPPEAINGARIVGVRYIQQPGLTASDSNYKTITLETEEGEDTQTVVSVTTKTVPGGGTGTWASNTPKRLPLDSGPISLNPGVILTMTMTETGDGVTLPEGTWEIEFDVL